MATDVLPETQRRSQPPRGQQSSSRHVPSPGRWWKRALLVIGVVALLAPAAALISDSSREVGPKLTHTISRGDLIVTVTEQGTLESSENTEIKNSVRGQSTVTWVIESGTEVMPGDELVRLDTLLIEDAISERTKYAHWSRSAAERSKADVARSELAISEYLDGRYRSQLMKLEKDLAIAESHLRTARNMLAHVEMLAERGYVSQLDVQDRAFAVTEAELNVEVKETEIDALKRFAKEMELETLKGNLNANKARHDANKERADMDAARRDLALEELEHCVIKAERSGLVIHPSAARWRNAPEIEEGATVYRNQVLLLMPDLSNMQVKIGIHESIVDRIKPGLAARITLPDRTLDGEVSSVASVTAPAGWWNGNEVKYDTIIQLPAEQRLKPGMSADVKVIIDRHSNVLMIPVAAIVETAQGDFCWVKTVDGAQRRSLRLGDTNDVFTVVKAGVKEGDEVMLNPLAFKDAQKRARQPHDESQLGQPGSSESSTESPSPASSKTQASDSKSQKKPDLKPKLDG